MNSAIQARCSSDDQELQLSERFLAGATIGHLGLAIENSERLLQVVKQLPYSTIHCYTPYTSVFDTIQSTHLEGRILIPHRVEAIYPERWLFKLSKDISERRVAELLAYFPNLFVLKADTQVNFNRLAVRRLSLSRLYYELSIFFSIRNQVSPTADQPLIFLSNFFDRDDLEHFSPQQACWEHVAIVVNPLVRKEQAQHSKTPSFGGEQGVKKLASPMERIFSKIKGYYTLHKARFPFRFLRLLEQQVRHARFQLRNSIYWQRLLFWRVGLYASHKMRTFGDSLTQEHPGKILIISTCLTERKLTYFSRLFTPLINRFLSARASFSLILFGTDPPTCQAFEKLSLLHRKQQPQRNALNFILNNRKWNINVYLDRLFVENPKVKGLQILLADLDVPLHHRSLLSNTLAQLHILKYFVGILHFYTTVLDFEWVVGIEEDIEYVSIMNLLKPVLKKDYTTFIIPSCLPEYSECYDCVSVDHLSVALPFIREIFVEQQLNAQSIHVIGSQEWEEPYENDAALPIAVERLLQQSTFTLGILHQPNFVTQHGQVIYNNLTIDFLDVYQRFLQAHPTACILIKPHPRDDLEQLMAYLPDDPRIAVLPKELPNPLFYQKIDAALSIHSTMVVHAVAHGVPVVALYRYPDYTPLYRFLEQVGCLGTDSHDEALIWLARLQRDAEFRDSVYQKMGQLRQACRQTPTSDRVANIMRAIQPGSAQEWLFDSIATQA